MVGASYVFLNIKLRTLFWATVTTEIRSGVETFAVYVGVSKKGSRLLDVKVRMSVTVCIPLVDARFQKLFKIYLDFHAK